MIRKFKLDDTVYTPSHGMGTIKCIDMHGDIDAVFGEFRLRFDKDGISLYDSGCIYPTLSHNPWTPPSPDWSPDYEEGDIVKIYYNGFTGRSEIGIVREHISESKLTLYPGTTAHLLEPFSEIEVDLRHNTLEKIGSIHETN